MFQLHFTLKQHTPIIHFQHEQEGATLRAAELKPKLDRYIYNQWLAEMHNDKEATLMKYGSYTNGFTNKSWIVELEKYEKLDGKNKTEYLQNFIWALDYKISIFSKGGQKVNNFESIKKDRDNENKIKREKGRPKLDNYGEQIYERHGYPSFFGNMDKEHERKELIMDNNNIQVSIVSFKQKLLEVVSKWLPLLVAENNFGTRQSKGFGSFLKEDFDISILKKKYYYFTIVLSNNNDIYNCLFERLDWFYRTLRSGINVKNRGGSDKFYFKSLMFHYAKKEGQQWDKKTIRDHFFSQNSTYLDAQAKRTDSTGTFAYTNINKEYIFRDLLGLSSRQDWFSYKSSIEKTGVTKENGIVKVDRFKSPITLKPIKTDTNDGKVTYQVFVILHDIPSSYLNETLEITSNSGTGSPKILKLWSSFVIRDYLKFCFNEFFISHGSFDEAKFEDNIDQPGESIEYSFLIQLFEELSVQHPY